MTEPVRQVLAAVVAAGAAYLRWTQLVPMLVVWAFVWIMVLALLLVNFQDQAFTAVERAAYVYEDWFGGDAEDLLGPPPDPAADPGTAEAPPAMDSDPAVSADGALHFDDEDMSSWLWRYWALLSLAGWLLGGLRTLVFGPREPWRLGVKLKIAAGVAVLAETGMFAARLWGSETFNGGPLGWVALFLGVPLLAWLVSAWSLSVAHLLDRLADVVGRTLDQDPDQAPGYQIGEDQARS